MTVLEEIYTNAFGTESRAKDLYNATCLKGLLSKGRSFFTGKRHTLFDITGLTLGKKVASNHYLGLKKVSIDKIKGSEGRCADFDGDFHPLKSHNRDRWIGIACAFELGVDLPPVVLTKIGEVYAVRDGHHRISVAKAYGASTVEAYVTELSVS